MRQARVGRPTAALRYNITMKIIKLTQGKQTIVDDEDYQYLSQWKWHYDKGYVYRTLKKISMHRVLMQAKKGQIVDHINLDTLDNRKSNLRFVTRLENSINRAKTKANTSGYKGAYKIKRTYRNNSYEYWVAKIRVNKRIIHIGTYDTAKKAGMAYKQFVIREFGESFAH